MTRVVRVLPDVAGLGDKVFDYAVPDHLHDQVRVGSIVRISLQGRRVAGWVVADHVTPPEGVRVRPMAKVTGWGPPAPLVALARWAARRWAGPVRPLLRTASPPGAVRGLPPPPAVPGPGAPAGEAPGGLTDVEGLAGDALDRPRSVVRLPPGDDPYPIVAAAARFAAGRSGDALVLTPSASEAALLVHRLRLENVAAALSPRDWAKAAAGGSVVVGARAAAWCPAPSLAAVVVLDAHDQAYQEERAPTWNAWVVAAERARRDGAPCLLVSACPVLEQLAWGELVTPSRAGERAGWPVVEVVDRRNDDPRSGLYPERLVPLLRAGGRVACVLNRKGRARLLACASCGEITRCEHCRAGMVQVEQSLSCRVCGKERPGVCQGCGATRLRTLRPGVSRVREELEALARRPVAEVTGDSRELPGTDVLVGTEALLHRLDKADVVVFLDFDQELLAPRFRAPEQALALLARAGGLVGGRYGRGRVVVQTRAPGHEVIQAAVHADPGRLAQVEGRRRELLRLPPATALAAVSGTGAAAFLAALPPDVEVLGPSDGRWLVRADDHTVLCDALSVPPRAGVAVRVEVDPSRA